MHDRLCRKAINNVSEGDDTEHWSRKFWEIRELLETKKNSGHTQDQVLSQAAQGKRRQQLQLGGFWSERSLSASNRQWVQQLPVQQQARLNHGLHEARSSKPWHLKQLGSGGFLRWRGWRNTGRAGSMLCLWSENFKLTRFYLWREAGHLKPILNHSKLYDLRDFSNWIHFSWQRSAERSRVDFFSFFSALFLVG